MTMDLAKAVLAAAKKAPASPWVPDCDSEPSGERYWTGKWYCGTTDQPRSTTVCTYCDDEPELYSMLDAIELYSTAAPELAREVLRLSEQCYELEGRLSREVIERRQVEAQRDQAIVRAGKAERLAEIWIEELEWLQMNKSGHQHGGVLDALRHNVEHRDEVRAAEAEETERRR